MSAFHESVSFLVRAAAVWSRVQRTYALARWYLEKSDISAAKMYSTVQAQAAALLAVVAGQDVEADPKVPGRWRIARRVAKGRVISTVDPEARHARKSRSQRRDGYKAHICAEPDTGLITAAELTTADTSDAQVGPRLLQQDPTAPHNTADTDTDSADTAAVGDVGAEGFVGLVLADSAYASGEALDAFAAAGYDTAIKPINPKPRITGGFTRDDFTIDTDAQTVTCPAGHTKAVTSAAARAVHPLQPAESARTRTRRRACDASSPRRCPHAASVGSASTAASSTAVWSVIEFAAALPGRNCTARHSPVQSANAYIGWNPNPPL